MSETNLAAFEKIIKALPSCVYYKDTEGKYVFATPIGPISNIPTIQIGA